MIQHPRSSASKNSTASRLLAAIAGLSLAAAPAAYAANTTWVGNTDANFSTLANWNTLTPTGNTPVFGAAGSSGTTLNNDLSGATYIGLTYNSGASAFTIGGNSFTLTGNIVNNSTSTQTINTPIVISGARQLNATSGQLVFGGNISGANGTLTLTGANKITLGGTNNLTMTTNFGAVLANGAGGVDITGATTITGAAGNTFSGFFNIIGNSTVTVQSGGSLAYSGTANASKPNSIIGDNAAGTSTMLVNGGSLTVGGNTGFALGNNRADAIGVLTISSGTATINRGTLANTGNGTDTRLFEMGRDGATGIVNLNGGTLATDRQIVRDGSSNAGTGTANFVFNGGTLKALATQTDWLQSTTATIAGQNNGSGTGTLNTNALALSSVTTTSAASTIDSNGFTVAINNAITGSGGFHIVDSSATTGVVNFGGSSYGYTGVTSVDSGTFNTNAASVAFSGNLAVAGGKFTANGAGAGSVSTTGFSMSSGTWTVSIGDTVSTSGNMSITGGVLDVAAFSGSEATYSTTGYSLFTSIGGTGLVSGLSITGYDTTNYLASLSNAGVLTFAAVPEPSSFAALAGLAGIGFVATRRRRSAAQSV